MVKSKVDDQELMNLAEQATPNGAADIGYGYDPATVTNDSPMARQAPEGTPGAVEGPVQGPFDNPIMMGVSPQAQAAASESNLQVPELSATPQTPAQAAAAPQTQAPAPGSPPDAVPQAVDAENPVNPATSQPYQQPPFEAPKLPLRTGAPTMGSAVDADNAAARAGFDEAAAQHQVGTEKGKEREANAQILDKEKARLDQQNAEQQKILDAHQVGREKAEQARTKAEDEYKDFQFHDYFHDKSVGSRILAGIFVGLGGGMGENHALQRQNALIDQDFKKQQELLGTREKLAKMKGEDQQSLETGYLNQLGELKLKQAGAAEAAATAAKAQAMRNGASVEQAENSVLVQGLIKKAMETRAKGMEEIAKAQGQLEISRATLAQKNEPQTATADQAKAWEYSERLKAVKPNLSKTMSPEGQQILRERLAQDEFLKSNAAAMALAVKAGYKTVEQLLPPKDLPIYNAQRIFINSTLRRDSGAAISSSEYADANQNYLAAPGDSKEAQEQKLAARDAVTHGLAESSGRPEQFGYAPSAGVAKPGRGKPDSKSPPPAKRPTGSQQLKRVMYKGVPGTLVGNTFTPDA